VAATGTVTGAQTVIETAVTVVRIETVTDGMEIVGEAGTIAIETAVATGKETVVTGGLETAEATMVGSVSV
jgi:hypothetical protein